MTKPAIPKLRSDARSNVTRQRLCNAAIEVLVEHGFHGASFVKVCEKSGLSRGAIHHHYASMPDLLADVVAVIYERLFADVTDNLPQIRTRDDDLSDAIDVLWSHLQSPIFRVLLEIRAAMMSDPELASVVAEPNDRINQEVIARTIDRYEGRVGEATIRIVFAAMTGFALQYFTLDRRPRSRSKAYASEFLSTLKETVSNRREKS